jgi:hypothetical protein
VLGETREAGCRGSALCSSTGGDRQEVDGEEGVGVARGVGAGLTVSSCVCGTRVATWLRLAPTSIVR